MISGHGNNLYHFKQGSIQADFSSNIAFNNKSSQILAYLRGQMDCLQNYPDPEAMELCEMLAQRHGVSAGNILVTNGSAEAFYLIAHYLAQGSSRTKTRILTPSFAEYEDSCKLHHHELSFSDIRAFDTLDLGALDSIWLGLPNNPDGYRLSDELIHAQSEANPQCCFVLDCAYHELSTKREWVQQMPDNQIITHSLTKSFGIPGLRLGYIIANATTIARLQEMRPPWSVNALSLVCGAYILRHYDALLFEHAELMAESQYLQQEIAAIEGIELHPSGCNFFLCRLTGGRTARALQDYLITEHALLIRHAGNFRGLSEQHFRIAAQGRKNNNRLIKALKIWSSLPH